MKLLPKALLVGAAALAIGGCTSTAVRDPEGDESPLSLETGSGEAKRCIPIMQIRSTTVLDSQTIEFKMAGGKTYINILPHKCPGLRRNRPFMYRTSLSQLCDLDLITVLDSGGFGLRPLASCGLGRFEPLIQGGPAVVGDEEPPEPDR